MQLICFYDDAKIELIFVDASKGNDCITFENSEGKSLLHVFKSSAAIANTSGKKI